MGWLDQYEEHKAKWRATCPVIKAAEALVNDIEITGIPDDFDFGLPWPLLLAAWRHECTNYEDLLPVLPLCVDQWDQGIKCYPTADELIYEECPLREEAHWLLQQAARTLYHRTFDHRPET